jgi:transcriptional regulator with GAF, ATPase, and Fis domain
MLRDLLHHANISTSSDTTSASPLEPNTASVIVCDRQCANLNAIQHVLSECRLTLCRLNNFSAIEEMKKSSQCSIALVGLSAEPASTENGLEIVRCLKQKGFQIISYQEDGKSWALGLQCQALLAGCSWLLDSTKPDFGENLRRLLRQVLQSEAERTHEEERVKQLMWKMGIVGESQTIISVFRMVLRLSALSHTPTLITGETGTGKELLAKAIRQLDPKRSNGPILVLNCGAISQGLAESELFGHKRGAFTGADRDRKGLFRAAQGGILFLDEIGEMDASLQSKLLRVIQENRILGVGEEQEIPVNVRVIAATNRSLEEMVMLGKFREDLFHRLSAFSVHIPPLRERPDDLQPLVYHFLKKHRAHEAAEPAVAGLDFIEALTQIRLPGNVRQLENLVRRALVNKIDNSPLTLGDLPPAVWQELSDQEAGTHLRSALESETNHSASLRLQSDLHSSLSDLLIVNGWNLSQALDYCEKSLVESALLLSNGNQSQSARLLGITSRSVYNKVRKHYLNFQ